MRGKITDISGQQGSGLLSLSVVTEDGYIEYVHGDWRCIKTIWDDLGIGAWIETVEVDGEIFIRPIESEVIFHAVA